MGPGVKEGVGGGVGVAIKVQDEGQPGDGNVLYLD